MAHGYLVKLLHKEASIYSAGIEKHGLNPYAVSVMKMDGVDISGNSSNLVDEYMSIEFDYIITVCDHANETCPYIPSKNAVRIHKNFLDPSATKIDDEDEKRDAALKPIISFNDEDGNKTSTPLGAQTSAKPK